MFTNADLNIIIGVSAIAIASLAYVNKLATVTVLRRVKYRWILTLTKSTKFKLSVTIVAGIIGILASIKKDYLADEQRAKDFKTGEVNQLARQKKHEADLKQLSEDNLKNFGSGLAKYYLKYDSVSKEIKSVVRDSSKTKVIEANRPELAITDLKVHLDTNTFVTGLVYTATQSALHNFDGKLYIMVRDLDNNLVYLDLHYNNLFMNIPVGTSYIKNLRFEASEPTAVSKIYYLTLGSYTDGKGNKFNCNIISAYMVESQETVGVTKKELAWVMDQFRKNGIRAN